MSDFQLISRSRRGCGKVGIPRGLRDFQAEWESRFLTFPLRGFSTVFRVAIFSAACHADISWAVSTGHLLEQRRLLWLAPRAHLAIVPPPRVIRFGRGRLLFLGLGLPGSYCLSWNRAWNLLLSHRPTAIANL